MSPCSTVGVKTCTAGVAALPATQFVVEYRHVSVSTTIVKNKVSLQTKLLWVSAPNLLEAPSERGTLSKIHMTRST